MNALQLIVAGGIRARIWVFATAGALAVTSLMAQSTGSAQAPGAPAATPKMVAAKAPGATKPDWSELTPAQQAALQPLQGAWTGISSGQKRKWIALSANFPSLTPSERSVLHGRMTDWTALNPEQRSQARLNFAQTKDLSAEEKKAQWQAYQALSPEQKQHLAATAPQKPGGAARAVTPVAPEKLAAVPVTRSEAAKPALAASRPSAMRPVATAAASVASAPLAKP